MTDQGPAWGSGQAREKFKWRRLPASVNSKFYDPTADRWNGSVAIPRPLHLQNIAASLRQIP